MRVLMIVQELNERNWLRGFIVGWVRGLANHVEHLHVLTLEHHETDLPENVTVQSMGKEHGHGRARELLSFYRGVGNVIGDVDVVFSHMTPRYTWLAAPYAMLYRKPQMLWFTHPKVSTELHLALGCVRWVTTATETSFPVKSRKVHVMGHGIDTEFFSPSPHPTVVESPPLVLAVGRITPIKNHHVLLEAAAHLPEVQFKVLGDTAAAGDEDYRQSLLRRRDELGIDESHFSLVGAVKSDDLVSLYRRALLVTNLTPAGSFDKAGLEAMLTGVPLLTINPAYDAMLGNHRDLLSVPNDAAQIAERIKAIIDLSPEEHQQIGLDLRNRTAQAHGLDHLMSGLVELMGQR